jgi:hypothetical protein
MRREIHKSALLVFEGSGNFKLTCSLPTSVHQREGFIHITQRPVFPHRESKQTFLTTEEAHMIFHQ